MALWIKSAEAIAVRLWEKITMDSPNFQTRILCKYSEERYSEMKAAVFIRRVSFSSEEWLYQHSFLHMLQSQKFDCEFAVKFQRLRSPI